MIMEADRPVSRRELANVIFMGESVKPEQLSVVLASRTRGSDPQEFIEGPLFPGSAHGNSQPVEVVCWFWDYAQAPWKQLLSFGACRIVRSSGQQRRAEGSPFF